MIEYLLRLKLVDFKEYQEIPTCRVCGVEYKAARRFYKCAKTATGNYLFHFASPEGGFVKGDEVYLSKDQIEEEVHVSKEDLENIDIGPDLRAPTAWQQAKLFQLIFDDPKNPDVRIRWRRLRSFLTHRYKHPKPDENNTCPIAEEESKVYTIIGPPPTIFQWAQPLFVALYALGLNPREILSKGLLPLGEQTEVYQSVRRQIDKYMETLSEAEQEELKTLHEANLKKYKCAWNYPTVIRGMEWQVSVQPKQGATDPRTYQWLKKLADKHKKDLDFTLEDTLTEDTPISLVEKYI
jgi:hypothetical protein